MAVQTDEFLAGINDYIIKEVPNGLDKATPFLKYVTTDGKKFVSGGKQIQFDIKLLENEASGFINGTSDLTDNTPNQQLQYGVLEWKFYNHNISITLEDFTKRGGEEDMINSMTQKIQGALEDSYNELSTALHGTNTADSKKFNGLQDIVAASGTAYAGLTDTDYASDAYLPYISTATVLNYSNVQAMINKIRARKRTGKSNKTFGLMNDALYSKYQAIIQNQQLAVNTNSLYATGFEGFKIGGVEFYLDADCPGSMDGSTADNYLYILPMDVLQFAYKFGLGKGSPFDGKVSTPNGTVMTTRHFLVGNLICTNRREIAVCKTFIA